MPPRLPEQLLVAYRDSHYRVATAGGDIAFRVDIPSEGLAALLERHDCEAAALITAANPRSHPCSDKDNASRNAQLRDLLAAASRAVLDAEGSSPDGSWREPSWFAIGIAPGTARELAGRFGQNAILLVRDGVARLEVTRSDG